MVVLKVYGDVGEIAIKKRTSLARLRPQWRPSAIGENNLQPSIPRLRIFLHTAKAAWLNLLF
ncbi:MAG: hypothetical protein LBI39_04540 [Puniceicoccales bacterium]|nr:hypothetical protein [Puniceicoccales bacterium]